MSDLLGDYDLPVWGMNPASSEVVDEPSVVVTLLSKASAEGGVLILQREGAEDSRSSGR